MSKDLVKFNIENDFIDIELCLENDKDFMEEYSYMYRSYNMRSRFLSNLIEHIVNIIDENCFDMDDETFKNHIDGLLNYSSYFSKKSFENSRIIVRFIEIYNCNFYSDEEYLSKLETLNNLLFTQNLQIKNNIRQGNSTIYLYLTSDYIKYSVNLSEKLLSYLLNKDYEKDINFKLFELVSTQRIGFAIKLNRLKHTIDVFEKIFNVIGKEKFNLEIANKLLLDFLNIGDMRKLKTLEDNKEFLRYLNSNNDYTNKKLLKFIQ